MHSYTPVRLALLACLPILAALSARALEPQAPKFVKTEDGIVVQTTKGLLKIELQADNIVRVAAAPEERFFSRSSPIRVAHKSGADWKLSQSPQEVVIQTRELRVHVDLETGSVRFRTLQGEEILAEKSDGRWLDAAEVQGEKTFHVRQQWKSSDDEALFGLGQFQLGFLNIKGHDLSLWQRNTSVVVPFLVSNQGYGILWDNLSYTRFGDLSQPGPLNTLQLFDNHGQPGGLTTTYFADPHFGKPVATTVGESIDINVRGLPYETCNASVHPSLPQGDVSVRWDGFIESKTTGLHTFHTYASGGLKLWFDGELVYEHWRQEWLPADEQIQVKVKAGTRHRLRIEWVKDQKAAHMSLRVKLPTDTSFTSLWSEVADGIDYTFVYGPDIDRVIAGYRSLTGQAPLMPKWAFGLWQSRQRYKTAQESIDVVKGFRSRGIPFDNIVQDWFYWRQDGWGSHKFDPERFPNPEAWIKELHGLHAQLMISVWGKFYTGTENFEELNKRGFLYQPNLKAEQKDWVGYVFTFYDAFNAEARKLYWSQMDNALFKKGVDAWWMDASEPDLLPLPTLEGDRERMNPTAMGSGARVLNAYPLMQSQAVYEGQRSSAPDQRVFNLTRSGFAGQQRYAAAVWSGDISSTWTAMRKQIPAGLGFCISGMPYWTMDCGGFSVPQRFVTPTAADQEEWRELNTRWFQFATFTPILRVHGEEPFREMWEMGGEDHPAYQVHLKFDRIRYRLLPYIYSLAGAVTHDGGTIMRPLVMEFRKDPQAASSADQYFFGPALMVCPVTSFLKRSRPVYLPDTQGGWYDFWTGAWTKGGGTIEVPAPYEQIPIRVRAGSIIPCGPELQYAGEKPAEPLTLYVYSGADASFTLYEDDGVSYAYERGACSRIPLRWDDAAKTLTIGVRSGSFPGMLEKRNIRVVMITPEKAQGHSVNPTIVAELSYAGDKLKVKLP